MMIVVNIVVRTRAEHNIRGDRLPSLGAVRFLPVCVCKRASLRLRMFPMLTKLHNGPLVY